MRRRRRKRRAPVKKYSLGYLLSHQPKSLRKHEYYPVMMSYYRNSERLQRLRMNRRCYSLLQHARIEPQNLHYFYRTYGLPKDPFFPVFFKIKRDYLQEQTKRRQEKVRYIAAGMRSLPEPTLEFIKYLGRLEQSCNQSGGYPVWNQHIFPRTKKRLHEYIKFDNADWVLFFKGYLANLSQRYRRVSGETAERLFACYVLDCLPEKPILNGSLRWPDTATVTRQYRRLSMLHHPDRGGEGEMFVELKRARDVLDGRGKASSSE
jgi:hypothetical protein